MKVAVEKAFDEYDSYMKKVRAMGKNYMDIAESNNMKVIVLAGRPYHIDPEINHGIAGG
ncbi:MAG: acyl-CoA dehydratase activase-related protein [Sedimentibacter sp.]